MAGNYFTYIENCGIGLHAVGIQYHLVGDILSKSNHMTNQSNWRGLCQVEKEYETPSKSHKKLPILPGRRQNNSDLLLFSSKR